MAASIGASVRLRAPGPAAPRRAARAPTLRVLAFANGTYTAPSAATAANQLQLLSTMSEIVPDLRGGEVLAEAGQLVRPAAATVSNAVLGDMLGSEALGMKPYQNAVMHAMAYPKCAAAPHPAQKLSCQLDKALVNVGALLAEQVSGRVCTEIDPRLAGDKDKMISKANSLLEMYKELGVPPSKLIFRLPATWAGLQAAGALEARGIATQAVLVYSLIQGVAAAQAGVSVIQPNSGRVRDWYARHPNYPRDPTGPREDAGFRSAVDPGLRLTASLYNYVKKHHPRSKVMASGLRTADDALSLAGCDYLVLGGHVLKALADMPTTQGYNDGLTGTSGDNGLTRTLSPEASARAPLTALPPVSQAQFDEGLGEVGHQLLDAGLKGLVADAERLMPAFRRRTGGNE